MFYVDFCQLFSSNCTERVDCEGCKTEKKGCQGCGSSVFGRNGGNVISVTTADSEDDCKKKCQNETECNFYTYFNNSHETCAKTCLILSDVQGPFSPCENCFTGRIEH